MSNQLSYTLFTEKYRPSSVKDMLLPNKIKKFFLNIIEEGEVPNLLLYSSVPGAGKTSIAKAICNDLNADYLYINISSESGIDTLRGDISRFASGRSLTGQKKIVILDEFDGASLQLQKAFRGFSEEYQNVCRFIVTCNYVNKIIPALHSRLQAFDFNMSTKEYKEEMIPKVTSRLCSVLKVENVEYNKDTIQKLVESLYPDIRKMYGILQQYSNINGIIDDNIFSFGSSDKDFYELVLNKKLTLARTHMIDSGYNYEDMYVDMFHNFLPLVKKELHPQVILAIAEWQYRSSFSTDKEIPFVAMLVEIMGVL